MPKFEYTVKTAEGSSTRGLVFGSSMDHAVSDLTARGFTVESIQMAGGPPSAPPVSVAGPDAERMAEATFPNQNETPRGFEYEPVAPDSHVGPPTEERSYVMTSVIGPILGKVALSNLSFFFTQLGTMLQAGVPIVQCLDTLSKQTRDPRFRHVVEELKGHVEAGRPMSAGMQRYPEIFTPVMLSVVRTGEEGGFLDEALFTTAKYVEDEIEIRNLYRRVTIYPKLLVGASIFIILGANFIIGSINTQAQKLDSPLTRASVWFILIPIIIAMFLFFRVGLANFRIKYIWDTFVSYIPYVGGTVRQMAMTKFGRAFGAMYKAGVPLPRVLQLSADSCGNEFMRARLYPAIKVIESGAGVTETLRATNSLSPIVLDMLATGERTGNLDQMLNKVADYYHDEAKTRSVALGYIVGVVIFLCVAIYIGYIVISFWSGYGSQFSNI